MTILLGLTFVGTLTTDDWQGDISCMVLALVMIVFILSMVARRNYPNVETKALGTAEVPNEDLSGRRLDGKRQVLVVQADGIEELRKFRQGTTVQGNKSRVDTRVAPFTWHLGAVDWANEPPCKPEGVSWGDYYAALRKAGWKVQDE